MVNTLSLAAAYSALAVAVFGFGGCYNNSEPEVRYYHYDHEKGRGYFTKEPSEPVDISLTPEQRAKFKEVDFAHEYSLFVQKLKQNFGSVEKIVDFYIRELNKEE
ncbi:hypothetical protein SMSP2_01897 [Limihaloglobus sulfuriphilus]|uniref:Uncharacterized protein n=1 Tax=Limihaloglobus sulfuriphilus TaxID=1851148 RepID=A0A1Q2MFP6_9BACT|nr:hypothetical protein [Limihaloglobus sulfuriphilus]AQQ71523.1 hypothetical protein SMSP2_01897 [Limihaloglobus sulfuriphilus]